MASDDAGMRSDRVNFLNNEFGRFQEDFWISKFVNFWRISNEFPDKRDSKDFADCEIVLKLFKQGEKDERCVKNVKNAEISSKNTFVNINVILGIVRKRRLTAEGPERASTTCSRSLRRGGGLRRYEIQRHRQRKETGPKVRRRYVLVKETTQQNRNSVKKVQYSATDIVENV